MLIIGEREGEGESNIIDKHPVQTYSSNFWIQSWLEQVHLVWTIFLAMPEITRFRFFVPFNLAKALKILPNKIDTASVESRILEERDSPA